eukprot:1210724-Prymnesium_polylepis.1
MASRVRSRTVSIVEGAGAGGRTRKVSVEVPLPRVPVNWTRKELEGGNVLLLCEELDGGALQYHAESTGSRRLTFTIDFRESSQDVVVQKGDALPPAQQSPTAQSWRRSRAASAGSPGKAQWWKDAIAMTGRAATEAAHGMIDEVTETFRPERARGQSDDALPASALTAVAK